MRLPESFGASLGHVPKQPDPHFVKKLCGTPVKDNLPSGTWFVALEQIRWSNLGCGFAFVMEQQTFLEKI